MAVVPRRVDSDIRLAPVSGEKLRPVRTGAIGDALGEGLQKVAGETARFAVTQDELDAHADQLAGRAAALEYRAGAKRRLGEFKELRGANAVNGSVSARVDLDTLREQALEGAANPRQRAIISASLDELHPENLDALSTHTKDEQFKYSDDTYTAEAIASRDDAALSFADPEKQKAAFARMDAALDRRAVLLGWSPEVRQLAGQDQRSAAHSAALAAMLAQPDGGIDAAQAYFAAHKEEMTFAARNDFQAAIKKPLEDRDSEAAFAEVASAAPAAAAAPAAPGATSRPGGGVYQMPVQGTVTSTFEAHRRRGSAGYDIAAPLGTAIRPIAGGVVIAVEENGRAGKYVIVRHPDQTTSSYSHMGGFSVQVGNEVSTSTVLGTVGMTGRTTGPHVHLRTKDKDGNDIDPATLFGQRAGAAIPAAVTGQPSTARNWDQGAVLARIEARTDWSPEKRARVRAFALGRMGQDESALSDQYQDAASDAAVEIAKFEPGKFTSTSQLSAGVRSRMDPAALADMEVRLKAEAAQRAQAAANAAATGAQSQRGFEIEAMRRLDPEGFKKLDLTKEVGRISPSQFNTLVLQQIEARQKPAPVLDVRSGITTAISFGKRYRGIEVSDEDFPHVYDTMEAFLRQRAATRPLVRQDYDDALAAAYQQRPVVRSAIGQFFFGDATKPLHEITYDDIPSDVKGRAWNALRAQGVASPTKGQIVEYVRMGGQ